MKTSVERLRSGMRIPAAVAIGVLALVCVVSAVMVGTSVAGVVLGLLGVVLIWLAAQALQVGVDITDDHLVVRGFLRSRRVVRDQVSSVGPGMIDRSIGFEVWAPCLVAPSGEPTPLKHLARYGLSQRIPRRVEHDLARLQAWVEQPSAG